MPIEALEGLTDQDLFNEANADEVPADEVETEAQEAETEQDEQPRDESGRFAGKPTDETEKPVAETQAEKPVVDDNAPQVPSWRVREINEEKRAIAAENERIKAELAELRQARQQPVTPPAPKVEAAKPDPLLDPDGYEKYLETKFEERLLNDRREASLANAHKAYKGEFEEAYAAAQKAFDPALAARMQRSRDPGETLIEWHREQKTRAEVGNDPNAYFQKKLDAWLADPANQAKVIERARNTATQQPGQIQQGRVSLPPSLTRATNASADSSADDNDISNDGLWRHANA